MSNQSMQTMNATLSCRIKLPAEFRQSDVLAFHRRDVEQLAERIDGNVLHKGLPWNNHPACLTFRFNKASVAVELVIDGSAADGSATSAVSVGGGCSASVSAR